MSGTICFQIKTRVDTGGLKRETTFDYRGQECRYPFSQLISCVVSREKRVSVDPLYPDSTGKKKRQFLLDVLEC